MTSATVPHFQSLPLHPAAFASTLGSAVVVAPHPDDEALGCGGLLALLRQARQPVGAVLVSDGTMSHPNSRQYDALARQTWREAEFKESLGRLGIDAGASNVLCLGLPDGAVPAEASVPGFALALEQLVAFLKRQQPATLLCPWRRDPHPDHRATSRLVRAALARLPRPPRLLEYVVWAWQRALPADLPQPGEATGWQLDVGSVLTQKQHAIAAHRSQLPPGIFTDDPNGFLLAPDMLAHFAQPYEVYFELI